MIAYVDSSVLARAYLRDEDGSEAARRLLADRQIAGEPIGFASRDGDQAGVAESLGFAAV